MNCRGYHEISCNNIILKIVGYGLRFRKKGFLKQVGINKNTFVSIVSLFSLKRFHLIILVIRYYNAYKKRNLGVFYSYGIQYGLFLWFDEQKTMQKGSYIYKIKTNSLCDNEDEEKT